MPTPLKDSLAAALRKVAGRAVVTPCDARDGDLCPTPEQAADIAAMRAASKIVYLLPPNGRDRRNGGGRHESANAS